MGEYDPRWGDAIASIESRGSDDPYRLLGPVTRNGDQAHGKYQVMGANIPEWSKAATGTAMTPDQFLASNDAQEAVFKHRFGGYAEKYGNPQDAASAWFTGQPRSASVGERRDVLGTSGNSYVDKFNKYLGAPEGATAIQTAMGGSRPTGSTSMMGFAQQDPGALAAQAPGALAPQQPPRGYDWASALQGAGAGLASISSPAQGAALAALAAASKKQAAKVPDTGTWSQTIDPKTGKRSRINSLTGQVIDDQAHAPQPEKDKADEAYDTATGKAFADKNQAIADSAVSSHAALANLDTLKSALSNPDVYQGSGGESVAYMKKLAGTFGVDVKGVADADVAASLINKLTQESRTLNGGMPGSLSDRDLAFLKAANAGLDKTPEANKRIIEIYERLHNRNIEMNNDRLAYVQGGKHLDEGFNTQITAKWAAQKATADAADKAAALAAPASTPATAPGKSLKTSNGVSWSFN